MIREHTLYRVYSREMRENVKELRCFLVCPRNYLHPTASYFRQKQKVRFMICCGVIGLTPLGVVKMLVLIWWDL